MTERLEKLPLPLRKALYCLPLGFLWTVGLTFEQAERAQKTALRAMVATLGYLGYLLASIVLVQILRFASASENTYGWIMYYYQITGLVLYGVLLLLTFLEKGTAPLDRLGTGLRARFD